jgi:DNA repair protein RadA/Sms
MPSDTPAPVQAMSAEAEAEVETVPQQHHAPPETSRLRLVRTRAPSPEPELSPEELDDDVDIAPSSATPVPITDIAETSYVRTSTGLAPLDQVLNGGLVEGSILLLASPPGIGKSSLTLQMLAGLGHRCLYVTGEETREQIAGTARRVGALTPDLFVICETDIAKIFAHAKSTRAQTIAIDSIQKMVCMDVNGRAGSPGQLKECTERLRAYAKKNYSTVWLIGHVTNDGDIAGPKQLEHDVDVVLELSQGTKFEGKERILRCPSKNRFGPTDATAVGHFELTATGLRPIDADGWNEPL